MSEASILVVTGVVLAGISILLFALLIKSILDERRSSRLRKTWANFGLSIAFASLFLISWGAQAVAEWGVYAQDQRAHGEPTVIGDYLVQFGQSTLENWQSEFLQLFSFVVLSALLIHRGSAESKDSDDRIEKKIDDIAARLDELDARTVK
jgi:branched-subunit amino acid ABC-type transport system permease component